MHQAKHLLSYFDIKNKADQVLIERLAKFVKGKSRTISAGNFSNLKLSLFSFGRSFAFDCRYFSLSDFWRFNITLTNFWHLLLVCIVYHSLSFLVSLIFYFLNVISNFNFLFLILIFYSLISHSNSNFFLLPYFSFLFFFVLIFLSLLFFHWL